METSNITTSESAAQVSNELTSAQKLEKLGQTNSAKAGNKTDGERVTDYYAACISDEATRKAYGRYGNGMNAAFGSLKFFAAALGYTWSNKEERTKVEVLWNTFRQENEKEVKDLTGYHLVAATQRPSWTMKHGLRMIKNHKYIRVGTQVEEKEFLAHAMAIAGQRK